MARRRARSVPLRALALALIVGLGFHDEPYGAIVTKEAGVLVFRGLPPTRKVVVNPEGKTPLELKETTVRETNVVVFTQDDYIRGLGAKVIRLR